MSSFSRGRGRAGQSRNRGCGSREGACFKAKEAWTEFQLCDLKGPREPLDTTAVTGSGLWGLPVVVQSQPLPIWCSPQPGCFIATFGLVTRGLTCPGSSACPDSGSLLPSCICRPFLFITILTTALCCCVKSEGSLGSLSYR